MTWMKSRDSGWLSFCNGFHSCTLWITHKTKETNQTKTKKATTLLKRKWKSDFKIICCDTRNIGVLLSEAGQNKNHLSKIPSTSTHYSEKLGVLLTQGFECWALSYIKPATGKSPALFGKVNLGSSKKEKFAHQDTPTGSDLKILALLFFQTVSFNFQIWKGCCQLQDFM